MSTYRNSYNICWKSAKNYHSLVINNLLMTSLIGHIMGLAIQLYVCLSVHPVRASN